MDVTKNPEVLYCLSENQRIREANEYRHYSKRDPVPGEMEYFHFIRHCIAQEMDAFKAEGGNAETLEFIDWINDRGPIGDDLMAELGRQVPYGSAQIVALSTEVQHAGFWLVADSVEPLVLKPRFIVT